MRRGAYHQMDFHAGQNTTHVTVHATQAAWTSVESTWPRIMAFLCRTKSGLAFHIGSLGLIQMEVGLILVWERGFRS